MKKIKVLITGGSGLFGVSAALFLRDKYSIVLILHRRDIKINGVEIHRCKSSTLSNFRRILSEVRPDCVINSAGLADVDLCERLPHLAYESNVNLAVDWAVACEEQQIRYFHVSTDQLFCGSKMFMSEDEPTTPLNIYSKTKAEAERLILLNNPGSFIMRTNFFGWGPRYRKSFSDWIINASESRCKVNVRADVFFTPITLSRLCDIIDMIIKHPTNGIYNIVGDERVSKYQFAIRLLKELRIESSSISPTVTDDLSGGSAKRPKDMSLSNAKLRSHIGLPVGDLRYFFHDLRRQRDFVTREFAAI